MAKIPLTHLNIIEMLGIESLPTDQKQEILMTATELVETRASARLLEMLSDEQKAEFAYAIESEDADAISQFFQDNEIDYFSITEEEIDKVKEELLEVAKEV